MDLDVRQQNGVTVVSTLAQTLDVQNADSFRDRLLALATAAQGRLVLDLRSLRQIDSSGLGAIITALKQSHRDATLVLDPTATSVREVFKLTRLDRIFHIVPSLDEALALKA